MKRMSKRAKVEDFIQKRIKLAEENMAKFPAATDEQLNKMHGPSFAILAHEYHRGRRDGYQEALSEFRRQAYR